MIFYIVEFSFEQFQVDLSHSNQQEAEAARQEVRLLASLKHPNIVSYKVTDYCVYKRRWKL